MAYHDTTLVPSIGHTVQMKKPESPENSTKVQRPFRRRAALEAESRRDLLAPRAPEEKRAEPAIETQDIRHMTDDQPEKIQLPATRPATWDRLPVVSLGMRKHLLARSPLVSFFREDPAAKAFDLLRTRLLHALKSRGWRRVAVAAPTAGSGATFTAVNLALSLARVPDSRTLLVDLNLRDPGIAPLLGLTDIPARTREFLKGHIGADEHLVRCSDTLALGLAGEPVRDASELLQAPASEIVLDEMIDELSPDVVLYDLPAVLRSDDLQAFLPNVDAVLLVADATRTTGEEIRACEKVIGDAAPLLGIVLNRGRAKAA
ncbi:CpsD/CapB family tyrosine-protein kinase [Lutimaribacter marinistellae]|uniref:CpsD/CapB family tyrosine-protein kinase n=1 Tax=Lutimaribacter marinistellae TaxID=1820329 RepID=A0ABV7TIR7_9RHOB